MEFYINTSNRIMPLIVICGTEFTVCGNGFDTHLWINKRNIKRSSAFIITDPDGSLKKNYANVLYDNGYNIKVLNLSNIKMSTRYNPLMYIRRNSDVVKIVNAVMNGTKGNGKPGDCNFLHNETNLLTALISYLADEATEEERNFFMLNEMLKSMETSEDYKGFKNAVDFLMEDKESAEPDHLSVTKYNHYKWAGKNKRIIIDSCLARIASLDTPEMRDFFSSDEFNLDYLYSPKTALFIVNGETNPVYKFLAPLMYSQILDLISEKSVQ